MAIISSIAHSKVFKYAILDDKVACELCYALIKSLQLDIQKCITWLKKKSGKGKQAWEVCVDFRLTPPQIAHPNEDEVHFECIAFYLSWFGILHIFVGFPTTTKNCLWIFCMADFFLIKANF